MSWRDRVRRIDAENHLGVDSVDSVDSHLPILTDTNGAIDSGVFSANRIGASAVNLAEQRPEGAPPHDAPPTAGGIGLLGGHVDSVDSSAFCPGDDLAERAAIIEYDGNIPRDWAEGLARLDPDHPPLDVPAARWLQFIDDIGRFLDGGFAGQADALGWGPLDLFGCGDTKPYARIDLAGLLWLLNGNRLVAITADTATIEARSGGRTIYRRKAGQLGRRVLAWELASTPLDAHHGGPADAG